MLQSDAATRPPAGLEALLVQREIEQFLFREAQLLDHRRFEEWYALLADDVHYFMPIRTNRTRREQHLEYSSADESAFFDDDKASMWMRIKKHLSPSGWAEDPPSRTRHIVSNVIVEEDDGGLYAVSSAFLLYRSRSERQVDIMAGERRDRLRRRGSSFEIAARTILLDQATLLSNNISFFF
jgi:biphenyl 2,3-dioxygenase beta subunit